MHLDITEAVSIVVRLTLIGQLVHMTLRRQKVLVIIFSSYALYYFHELYKSNSLILREVQERFFKATKDMRVIP